MAAVCTVAACDEHRPEGEQPPSPERIEDALRNASEVRFCLYDTPVPPAIAVSDPKVIAELSKRLKFERGWGKPISGQSGCPLNEVWILEDGQWVAYVWLGLTYNADEDNLLYRSPDRMWETWARIDNAFCEYLSGLVPEDTEAVDEFYEVVRKGETDLVASLLAQGRGPGYAMVDCDPWIYTPAQWALWHGQTETARYLVTEAGFEDVHALAAMGETRLLERLLDEKPWAANAVDWQGWTPLVYARGKEEVARLLHSRGGKMPSPDAPLPRARRPRQ